MSSFSLNGYGGLILLGAVTTLLVALAATAIGSMIGILMAAAKLSPMRMLRQYSQARTQPRYAVFRTCWSSSWCTTVAARRFPMSWADPLKSMRSERARCRWGWCSAPMRRRSSGGRFWRFRAARLRLPRAWDYGHGQLCSCHCPSGVAPRGARFREPTDRTAQRNCACLAGWSGRPDAANGLRR